MVSPTKEIPVCATDAVEQEFWRSSYHLRNSLKIAGGPEVSDEVRSMVDGGTGATWTTATVEEATAVAMKEARGERKNAKIQTGSDQDNEDKSRTLAGRRLQWR